MPGVSRSRRAWSRPIRPAPSKPTLISMPPVSRRQAPAVRCPRLGPLAETTKGRPEHPSTDRRALRRRTPAAVLLDHHPAAIAALDQRVEDAIEVEHAGSELREEAGADRVAEPRNRPVAQAGEDVGVHVLEMNVGHALPVGPQGVHGIAATDREMPDVQAQRDELRIGQSSQPFHLLGRLHERAGVGVEGHAAAGVTGRPAEVVEQVGQLLPASIRQDGRPGSRRPAGRPLAVRGPVEGHAQDFAVAVHEDVEPIVSIGGCSVGRAVHGRRQRGVDLG